MSTYNNSNIMEVEDYEDLEHLFFDTEEDNNRIILEMMDGIDLD